MSQFPAEQASYHLLHTWPSTAVSAVADLLQNPDPVVLTQALVQGQRAGAWADLPENEACAHRPHTQASACLATEAYVSSHHVEW